MHSCVCVCIYVYRGTLVLRTLHKLKVRLTIVEWVECMGVASGCGEQEAGVASGRGWNLWVWL